MIIPTFRQIKYLNIKIAHLHRVESAEPMSIFFFILLLRNTEGFNLLQILIKLRL